MSRFEGFVAKYMGDGILAYFGYPQAHEDDAEQALRAGLALIDAVGELQASQRLQVRIGIATGLVVVGDLVGTGSAQEQAVVGETPNLAARLQALAEPDSMVIADSTRRQIGARFEVQDLGPRVLKGFADPQRAWRVFSENRALGRFEALRSGATQLVGRDEEMELLLRRWARAKDGRGCLVLISGEPGVGKSRLTEVFAERIASEPHIRLRYFCSPHHQDSALYPIIAQQERTAGFVHHDLPAEKLSKLRTVLAAVAPPIEDVALIAELHSLAAADLASPLDVSPQRKKEKTFEALLRQVEGLSRQQPVLMVFEDIQWIDPSSRELLDLAIERIAALPVLLVATFRPEFQPPWIGHPRVAMLNLARLDRHDTAAMVANIAGHNVLLGEIVEEIAERTDGVPLFVEELTRAVLEVGTQAALPTVPHLALSVPATLHASLMARLDRLGHTAKSVAQTGAAIGREFAHALLATVVEMPGPELQEALDRLTNSGLLIARGRPPQASYIFKHALVQDSAYGTLLRSQRQKLHARIAATLEEHFPEILLAQPEILGQHCADAGLAEKAVTFFLQAGRDAMKRSANAEASAHLTKGLAILEQLPDVPTRLRYELQLQTALGPALMPTKGWGAPEVEQAYTRARELCHQLGAAPQRFNVRRGLWEYYELRAHTGPATELAEEILSLAEDASDTTLLLIAHDVMGDNSLWLGNFAAANSHTAQGIGLYVPTEHGHLAYSHGGYDPAMACRAFGAHALWYLGYPDRASKQSAEAVSFASSLSHPPSLVHALSHAALLQQFRRDAALARKRAQSALDLAEQQDSDFWKAHAAVSFGWALASEGQIDLGICKIREGMAAYRATGAELERTLFLAILAEALLNAELFEQAEAALEEALSLSEKSGVRFHLSEVYRLQGEFLLRVPGRLHEAALASFQRAPQIARGQEAKSLELRAGTSIARLWRDQGKIADAQALLAPIYAWFAEGFDAPDLVEAKTLLGELAERTQGEPLGRGAAVSDTSGS